MTLVSPEARDYLERLRDLLPPADALRVIAEVEALLLDRVEAQDPRTARADAERAALRHLGAPEALVDRLSQSPLQVGASARRGFRRWLGVLAAGHLLLAVLLTLGKAESAAVPGLLGPLPTSPWWGTLTAALGIVLLDAGLLFVLYSALGAWGRQGALPMLGAAPGWTRPDAWRTLLLVGLLALIAHPLRDWIFVVKRGATRTPFLAPAAVDLLPWLDVVLGLIALRALLVVVGLGDRALTHALDLLAGIAGVVTLLRAATAEEIVRLPPDVLGLETASVLNNVITRVLLLVFVAAALLLAVRVLRRLLRLRQALSA